MFNNMSFTCKECGSLVDEENFVKCLDCLDKEEHNENLVKQVDLLTSNQQIGELLHTEEDEPGEILLQQIDLLTANQQIGELLHGEGK